MEGLDCSIQPVKSACTVDGKTETKQIACNAWKVHEAYWGHGAT